MCEPLNRRQFLRYAGLVAATPLAVRAFGVSPARAASNGVPMHLELVTVTDTTATLTWLTADPNSVDQYGRPQPVPADTVVEWGASPLAMNNRFVDDNETAFHYVELTGLEPGRPYFYRCLSNGLAAVPTQVFPEPPATGVFTTLVPPSGELLLTMAWANDLHIGEMVSGLAYSNGSLPGGGVPPGFPADPDNPYWRVMAQAAVAEARERGAELLLLNGDLTSEAEPVFLQEAKDTFDAFGAYQTDYYVTRGNHDRAHAGATWSGCAAAGPTAPGYNDCIRDWFFPDGQTRFSFDRAGLHFVALDTVDLTTGNGSVPAEEAEWLRTDLLAHDGTPTFVFGHHPISEEGRATTIGGPGFSLSQQDAQAVEEAIAGTSVVGVYSGHTHRNKRTHSALNPSVPFIELGAVKEYPGGFGLVRVYEGGYMVNFHKTRGEASRAWSEQSRGEYLGLYPWYTLGSFADRNYVVPIG